MGDSEKRIRHLNKVLRSIRDVNQLIIHEKNREDLIRKACEILVRDQGYYNAWIVLFPRGDSDYLFSQLGAGEELNDVEGFIRSGKLMKCARRAFDTGDVVFIKDPHTECTDCMFSRHHEGRAAMIAPLIYNNEYFGIIALSIKRSFADDEEEIDLFREISGDLGYALWSIETEKKQKESVRVIEENEKKYRQLFDSANDMVYLHEILPGGIPGKILDANDKACRVMGYTKDEFLEITINDLNDPDYEGDLGKIIEDLKTQQNTIFEWVHVTKNKKKIPVEVSLHNFTMGEKNVALAVVRDISERKDLERELRLTLDATTDGIWKWDFKAGEVELSPRYYTIHGYKPGEFSPNFESWVSLIHPDDRDRTLKVIEDYLKTKPGFYENHYRLRRKDGGYSWVHDSGRVVERDEGGDAVRMIGNHEDITERMEREEKLRFTQFSVDRSPVSTFWTNPDGSFFYVNKAACKELGYSEKELLKLRIDDVDPGYPFENRDNFWKELKKERIINIETTHKSKDGRIFPVDVTVYYLNYRGREFEISNSVDITGRKLAEKKILESETKYRELFNNVSEAVFLHKVIDGNKRGHFVEVNNTACKRLGYTREELLQLSVSDINTPEIRKEDEDRVKQMKRAGSIAFEGVQVRKDGAQFPVYVKARMLEIGGEIYIMSLVRDITREKEIKKEQAEALAKIEENLMQMMALNDKIRNPLTVITGIVDLDESKNSDRILDQVREIDEIINELDRGWVESGKIRNYLRRHYEVELKESPVEPDGD